MKRKKCRFIIWQINTIFMTQSQLSTINWRKLTENGLEIWTDIWQYWCQYIQLSPAFFLYKRSFFLKLLMSGKCFSVLNWLWAPSCDFSVALYKIAVFWKKNLLSIVNHISLGPTLAYLGVGITQRKHWRWFWHISLSLW